MDGAVFTFQMWNKIRQIRRHHSLITTKLISNNRLIWQRLRIFMRCGTSIKANLFTEHSAFHLVWCSDFYRYHLDESPVRTLYWFHYISTLPICATDSGSQFRLFFISSAIDYAHWAIENSGLRGGRPRLGDRNSVCKSERKLNFNEPSADWELMDLWRNWNFVRGKTTLKSSKEKLNLFHLPFAGAVITSETKSEKW